MKPLMLSSSISLGQKSRPSVPPVDDPAMSHFDDSDSDSASEPDLDDSDDPPFVPDPVDDSEPDVLGSPPSPSPSASPDLTPEPLPLMNLVLLLFDFQ